MPVKLPRIQCRSLGGKFIFLVVVILSFTMTSAAYFNYIKQNDKFIKSVVAKGNTLGKFVALVSPDAILGFDFVLLDQYMEEVSRREDVVIGMIRSDDGSIITSYFNKAHPLIEATGKNDLESILSQLKLRRDVLVMEYPIDYAQKLLGTLVLVLNTERVHSVSRAALAEAIMQNGIIIVLLSICIYVVFHRNAITPIKHLIHSSQRMAQGDLLCYVDNNANDELGQLARSFNIMAESLRSNYAQLQESNEQLLRATKAKSTFLANMSHEIRTPLTAIIGYAELLKGSDILSSERDSAIDTIVRNGQHLQRIINDILDLSKIEAEKLEIENNEVNPFEILHDVELLMQMQAKSKNLSFIMNYTFPLPTRVQSDALRVKQVLINLCSNAIKFTEHGHVSIDVACDRDNQLLSFKVCDTGIGLNQDEMEKIFESFTQADASTTRRYGGTGLGLPLSRHLCQMMGGNLSVNSVVNKGSSFVATIATANLDHVAFLNSFAELEQYNRQSQSRHSTVYEPAAQNETKTVKGRILLAEDTPDNQRLIQFYLRKLSIELDIVENGLDAVNAVMDKKYTLILMDMQMPVMGGEEAVQRIRAVGVVTPILALTANALVHDRERYIAAGCDGFIAKPIVRTEFESVVCAYLEATGNGDDTLNSDSASQESAEFNRDAFGKQAIFSSLLDESDTYTELVNAYIDRLPQFINECTRCYNRKDWVALQKVVHNVKGTGSAYGFAQVSNLAQQIEIYLMDKEYVFVGSALVDLRDMAALIITGGKDKGQNTPPRKIGQSGG